MNVRFMREALMHIAGIRFYIEGRSPRAADHIVERIFDEGERLDEFPQLGRVGIVSGTYEWTVPGLPYVIVQNSTTGVMKSWSLACSTVHSVADSLRPGLSRSEHHWVQSRGRAGRPNSSGNKGIVPGSNEPAPSHLIMEPFPAPLQGTLTERAVERAC